MTPDQLRALAEALQQDIDELRLLAARELTAADEAWFAMHDKAIACLRACADEQPVMQFVESQGAYTFEFLRPLTIKPGDLFYLHPAPAAPQAEPKREPLDDDEISRLAWQQNVWTDGMIEFSFLAFARAVERAHGIGGSDAE